MTEHNFGLSCDLMEADNVFKHYRMDSGRVLKAVDGLSLSIKQGETLGLVGESGCGKSTAGKMICRLEAMSGGDIRYRGQSIKDLRGGDYRNFTKNVQMIFQDPYASLDSRMTAGDIVGEGMTIHSMYAGSDRQARIYDLLGKVGLNREHANRFPHEFSGGQRQRIGIARALAVEPEFIVCDEPISALDVSVQAQVINLLVDLQQEFDLTYLFIAHDLGVVKYISDRVAVMYLGVIVEVAQSQELYLHSAHPYTQALLSAIPLPDPRATRNRQKILLQGDIPTPINTRPGCKFQSRCRYAVAACREEQPPLRSISDGHMVACHVTER